MNYYKDNLKKNQKKPKIKIVIILKSKFIFAPGISVKNFQQLGLQNTKNKKIVMLQ